MNCGVYLDKTSHTKTIFRRSVMGESVSVSEKKTEVAKEDSTSKPQKSNYSQPVNSSIDRILFLQRTIGNQAVGRVIKSGALQAKLRIGQRGDIYEQEADRVAEQVMRTPEPCFSSKRRCTGKSTAIQRKCSKCKEDEEIRRKPLGNVFQTQGDGTPEVTLELEAEINALRGRGQPLPESVRSFFEPRFGYDFNQVRVHTDAKAAESARAVNALAYTVGQDIVFREGQYSPQTYAGRHSLAHELVHVIQQTSGCVASRHDMSRLATSNPNDRFEREADSIAERIIQNGNDSARITVLPTSSIQRQEESNPEDLVPTPSGGSGASIRPVFFCSKPVALGQRHAFFRIGSSEPGNPTFELEHDEYGDHCPCGIQGWPTRDYPEDRDATDARCISAPTITEACLLSNWATYPIGKYCALGPNSNTYARFLAERCGAIGLRPPGSVPGFDDSPPTAGTANPALDARVTFLPGACQTIDCDDDTCRRIYF